MTQFQFDVICNIINNGAPALANELIGALSEQINSSARKIEDLTAENAKLKADLAEATKEPEATEAAAEKKTK